MGEFRRFNATEIINNTITLTEIEHNHLSKVLRLTTGDIIIINIGDNNDYICKIINISKTSTIAEIQEIKPNIASKVAVTLFACVIKGSTYDLVVAKAVEMGVYAIVPVSSAYTVGDAANKIERLNIIAQQASKQCGRADIVKISRQLSFKQMLSQLSSFNYVIFCNEHEKNNHILTKLLSLKADNLAIIVGSEGGFSEDEQKSLLSLSNVISVSLGKRIYRAETASIAALAIIDAVFNS